MSIINKIDEFFKKVFFYHKWRCSACGKEIFEKEYFCEECKNSLPLNDGYICNHCGRKTPVPEEYCETCKNKLASLDLGRSPFYYGEPISKMIKRVKYYERKYLLDVFTDYLYNEYLKNYFNSDVIVYVPMTKERIKKRGYNQSKILAENLSEKAGIEVLDVIVKTKETVRQAKLSKKDRLKNLEGTFKVTDKKSIKGKSVLIVDDVTTTGATIEVIASLLKKAGAKYVKALTVASVPYKNYVEKRGE